MFEAITSFLIAHGLLGMFLSAFLAGSIFPLASEVVLAALVAAGLSPLQLLLVATLGNTLGSALNYGIGALGSEERIERWLRMKPEELERGRRWVRRFGFWAGLLAWLPVVGELITVALGFLRTSFPLTMLTVFVGKLIRYAVIIAAMTGASLLIF